MPENIFHHHQEPGFLPDTTLFVANINVQCAKLVANEDLADAYFDLKEYTKKELESEIYKAVIEHLKEKGYI